MQQPQHNAARAWFAPLLLFVLVPPATVRAQETRDTTQLPAALRTERAALLVAYTAFNAPAASKFFADSAVLDFQGQIMTGRPAIERWLIEMLRDLSAIRFKPSTFLVTDTEVIERVGLTVVPLGQSEQSGNSQSVWRRQPNGTWKIIRVTVS